MPISANPLANLACMKPSAMQSHNTLNLNCLVDHLNLVVIFFLNWNKEGGDLRIAHFLGIHALQVIPLFAWLLEKYLRKDSVKTVIVFSVFYTAVFTGFLVHALLGRPLF